MRLRVTLSSLVLLALVVAAGPRAAWAQQPPPYGSPGTGALPVVSPRLAPVSPFHYAFRGMLLGTIEGLAVGALVAHDDQRWEPYVYGAGIGAIAGGVLGLTVGLIDLDTPGLGYFILRDSAYGAAFGALVGGIAGGLIGRDGESIALGGAIGVLGGTALGAVVGVIDASHNRGSGYAADERRGVSVTVATVRASDGQAVWMPALTGPY